jgi:hypothetical protein
MAVTTCAGANGLVNKMLFGTPFHGHSSARAPREVFQDGAVLGSATMPAGTSSKVPALSGLSLPEQIPDHRERRDQQHRHEDAAADPVHRNEPITRSIRHRDP